MQDIIKIEDITDGDGNVIGKRMYTNDGVFKYDVDEDGNIIESTKTRKNQAEAVKVPILPPKPVRHRIPPRQKKLDCSRPAAACRKAVYPMCQLSHPWLLPFPPLR